MCSESPEEVSALAKAEYERHKAAWLNPRTKTFHHWWHGNIFGWLIAIDGDLEATQKFLGLIECGCKKIL